MQALCPFLPAYPPPPAPRAARCVKVPRCLQHPVPLSAQQQHPKRLGDTSRATARAPTPLRKQRTRTLPPSTAVSTCVLTAEQFTFDLFDSRWWQYTFDLFIPTQHRIHIPLLEKGVKKDGRPCCTRPQHFGLHPHAREARWCSRGAQRATSLAIASAGALRFNQQPSSTQGRRTGAACELHTDTR